jgi:hypothetical protein
VRKGDVVFYHQDTSEHVISKEAYYNHAAFIVGWGHLTDFRIDGNGNLIARDTYTSRAPRVVDHSGPYSSFGAHSINDTESGVNEMVIVHIPEMIYYPDVWSIMECV